jgi:hypothetical protein
MPSDTCRSDLTTGISHTKRTVALRQSARARLSSETLRPTLPLRSSCWNGVTVSWSCGARPAGGSMRRSRTSPGAARNERRRSGSGCCATAVAPTRRPVVRSTQRTATPAYARIGPPTGRDECCSANVARDDAPERRRRLIDASRHGHASQSKGCPCPLLVRRPGSVTYRRSLTIATVRTYPLVRRGIVTTAST